MNRYAVFGNPIGHSLSPKIHLAFAAQTQQLIRYEALCAPLDGFTETVGAFLEHDGKGFNVTVPFKQHAYGLVDEIRPRAQLAQAVNTVGVSNGKLWGDNTDGIGLVRDLIQNHRIILSNLNILIIGAGGAVRGVLGPLLEQKPKKIVLVNRTAKKAEELVELFNPFGEIFATTFNQLNTSFDLIINGSSASLTGELPPLPNRIIKPQHTVCYDMMYSKTITPFNQWAKNNNAKNTFDGLGMLVEQAAEAFYLWHGVRPDTAPVISMLNNDQDTI